jgi:hypothetical protein
MIDGAVAGYQDG